MTGQLVGGEVWCIWASAPGEKGTEETSGSSSKTEALSEEKGRG